MEPEGVRASIVGRWVHSHEEDEGEHMVLRHPDYDFPPSRGRTAITLDADGSTSLDVPGPDDRPQSASGRWRFADGLLTIDAPSWAGVYEVVAAERNRLVLSRQRKGV